MGQAASRFYGLDLEAFCTGITDAKTYNAMVNKLDEIMKSIETNATSSNIVPHNFGRNALITNAFLRGPGNIPSNVTGSPVHAASNLITIAAVTRSNSTCVFEIRVKGNPVALGTVIFVNQTFGSTILAVPVVAGDQIQCRVVGGPADRPSVVAVVG